MLPRYHPYATATGRCSSRPWRLQPYVLEAATLCWSAFLAERFFSLLTDAASAASLAGQARWWFLMAPLLPQGRSQYSQLSVRWVAA